MGQRVARPTEDELDMMRPSQRVVALSRWRRVAGIRNGPVVPVGGAGNLGLHRLIEDVLDEAPEVVVVVPEPSPQQNYPPTSAEGFRLEEDPNPFAGQFAFNAIMANASILEVKGADFLPQEELIELLSAYLDRHLPRGGPRLVR